MTKKVRRSNVKNGIIAPLGNGFSLAIGKYPEKEDNIHIGPNNKNGVSVDDGEILQNTGDTLRVFSAQPMFNGVSPTQLLYGGMNPNAVFNLQEQYKRQHRINDDGTRYVYGGNKGNPPVKKGYTNSAKRDSAQVNIFKPGPNNRIQSNRIAHRKSLEAFVKKHPTVDGINTADFVDFLLDNATMESENSPIKSHGSMYGYYQLKGLNPKSTEEQQHMAAYKHLNNLFRNVITDADIAEAEKQGISQAQLLHKFWNQERKVLNYLYQGKDNADGLGTKISEWGNNNNLEIDYSPYVMKAWTDDSYIIKKGDNYEKITKSYRGSGNKTRTFNDYSSDANLIFGVDPNKPLQIGQTLKVNTNKKAFGGIYIKPSKRGTFTAAAKKHGMSVQGFASKVLANKENYSSAMVKKANFAKNASKWKHLYGGEESLINPLGERPNANNKQDMKNHRKKALSGTQLGLLSAGMNTLGAGIGSLIQQNAINRLRYTPRVSKIYDPVKLKTDINIAPQLAEINSTISRIFDAADKTSASSRNRFQKNMIANTYGNAAKSKLLGEQENKETELINADRMNQQGMRNKTIDSVIDILNTDIAGKDQVNNLKRISTSNNWTTALNTTSGALHNFFDREAARNVKAGELLTQSIANPTAAKLLFGDIDLTTEENRNAAFKIIYDWLNNNRLG